MTQRTLLLVDQDEDYFAVLEIALGREGYALDHAPDGKVAKAMVSSGSYDILLTESSLPVVDGISFISWVRGDHGANVPIIVLSARADNDTREKALAAGADEYLVKPVGYDSLLSRLHDLLGDRDE